MPRATRAAVRAGLIHGDDPKTNDGQIESGGRERPPLEQIHENDQRLTATSVDSDSTRLGKTEKGKAKPKKAKARKKDAKKAHQDVVIDSHHQENIGSELLLCDPRATIPNVQAIPEEESENGFNSMFLNACRGIPLICR